MIQTMENLRNRRVKRTSLHQYQIDVLHNDLLLHHLYRSDHHFEGLNACEIYQLIKEMSMGNIGTPQIFLETFRVKDHGDN